MWGLRETYRAALIGGLGNIEVPWFHRVDLHNSGFILLLWNMPLPFHFHLLLPPLLLLLGDFWKKLLQQGMVASQIPKICEVCSWTHFLTRIYTTATCESGRLIKGKTAHGFSFLFLFVSSNLVQFFPLFNLFDIFQ